MNNVANNLSQAMSNTVLIVEDDAQLRDALYDTLALAGYDVMVAEHGHAAIARMSEQVFGMVISDVQMRPMDGMELLQSIRSANQDLPVVMMTAYGTIEKAVDAMRAGASDYLVKPFAYRELLARIRARTRTYQGSSAANQLQLADLTLNRLTRQVERNHHEITLTSKEFSLLEFCRIYHILNVF